MTGMAHLGSLDRRRLAKIVRAHPVPVSLIAAYLVTAVAASLAARRPM